MKYKDIIQQLKSLSNPEAVKGMAAYGINADKALGISIPVLRNIAKETGKDRQLAFQLWDSEIHEARILASMIDDFKEVDEAQMEAWVKEFDSWDLCDQCIMNSFEKTPYAWTKAIEWSGRDEEFVKRSGFVLMARLAVSDKKAPDDKFLPFFSIIKRESIDARNFVKKAVNWALRQIGKRNLNLNHIAVITAEEISQIDSKAAKWIATDGLKELKSEAVKNRLKS